MYVGNALLLTVDAERTWMQYDEVGFSDADLCGLPDFARDTLYLNNPRLLCSFVSAEACMFLSECSLRTSLRRRMHGEIGEAPEKHNMPGLQTDMLISMR